MNTVTNTVCLVFKQFSINNLHFFQAEDLVANFFPKKLLELDHFLKVSDMFIHLNLHYSYICVHPV